MLYNPCCASYGAMERVIIEVVLGLQLRFPSRLWDEEC